MSNALKKFFDAWGMEEGASATAISEAMADDAVYADPRSEGLLSGTQAIASYVKAFGANAPGWTATVVKEDTTADCTRVTVAFGGAGPAGKETVQHGQYFVEMDGTRIKRMVGFVGTGDPQ